MARQGIHAMLFYLVAPFPLGLPRTPTSSTSLRPLPRQEGVGAPRGPDRALLCHKKKRRNEWWATDRWTHCLRTDIVVSHYCPAPPHPTVEPRPAPPHAATPAPAPQGLHKKAGTAPLVPRHTPLLRRPRGECLASGGGADADQIITVSSFSWR
ncbi:hypothetical protein E2C01_070417 [Portunus trituberculatus]|uniref:Uncharacterized protein n=1 Tax=Portunus trituberculatus TaxID=210409 RepID=A0A5B7I223_PORTR|nr:hypothetical protein [Portunus trituberculatus]